MTAGFHRKRSGRCLVAALVLAALVLQGLAPYLPMPEMGGITSWDAAWLQPCPMHPADQDGKAPAKRPQDRNCTVCTVMQQAGSTLAPAEVVLPAEIAFARIDLDATRDTQTNGLSARAFSSRAPPRTA